MCVCVPWLIEPRLIPDLYLLVVWYMQYKTYRGWLLNFDLLCLKRFRVVAEEDELLVRVRRRVGGEVRAALLDKRYTG